jgi:hypothetical protein
LQVPPIFDQAIIMFMRHKGIRSVSHQRRHAW